MELCDTQGNFLDALVLPADPDERSCALALLVGIRKTQWGRNLQTIFADEGFAGEEFEDTVSYMLRQKLEIVRRLPEQKGFAALPKRWLIEQVFGCQSRYVGVVAYVSENVVLNYQLSDGEAVIFLEDELESLALWCQDEQIKPIHTRCEDEMKYASNELLDQFAADWLSYFRRGCWLSGYPIEASAHEKAEWIQDFSREELQAWNLKM